MLSKHELSFLKAARCLCNFQHLLVEKLSLKGPTADELEILPYVLSFVCLML